MESWRKERDALVSALEVQLQKLLTSQAEKDQLIQQLRCNERQPQAEVSAATVNAAYRSLKPLQQLKGHHKKAVIYGGCWR